MLLVCCVLCCEQKHNGGPPLDRSPERKPTAVAEFSFENPANQSAAMMFSCRHCDVNSNGAKMTSCEHAMVSVTSRAPGRSDWRPRKKDPLARMDLFSRFFCERKSFASFLFCCPFLLLQHQVVSETLLASAIVAVLLLSRTKLADLLL